MTAWLSVSSFGEVKKTGKNWYTHFAETTDFMKSVFAEVDSEFIEEVLAFACSYHTTTHRRFFHDNLNLTKKQQSLFHCSICASRSLDYKKDGIITSKKVTGKLGIRYYCCDIQMKKYDCYNGSGFDDNKKNNAPAWTDRVYRKNGRAYDMLCSFYGVVLSIKGSDHAPVVCYLTVYSTTTRREAPRRGSRSGGRPAGGAQRQPQPERETGPEDMVSIDFVYADDEEQNAGVYVANARPYEAPARHEQGKRPRGRRVRGGRGLPVPVHVAPNGRRLAERLLRLENMFSA